MKPGTSARNRSGTLNASHSQMKRAALSAESTNSTPPRCFGLFATMPTGIAVEPGEPDDQLARPQRLELEERIRRRRARRSPCACRTRAAPRRARSSAIGLRVGDRRDRLARPARASASSSAGTRGSAAPRDRVLVGRRTRLSPHPLTVACMRAPPISSSVTCSPITTSAMRGEPRYIDALPSTMNTTSQNAGMYAPPAADGPNRQHTCGTLPDSRTWLAKMRPAPRRPGTARPGR